MRVATVLISWLVMAGTVDADPLQVVVSAKCSFDQKCDLGGSACYDWHTEVAMDVWKIPTRLRSYDQDGQILAYGFENIGGYVEVEVEGRSLRGDVAFDTGDNRAGPIWEHEIAGTPMRFRAQTVSFDAWLMSVGPDGRARLTVTQNDGRNRAQLGGHCDVRQHDLETAWEKSRSDG